MTIKAVLVGVLAIGLAATPALAKKAKAPPAPPCVKDKVLIALETRMLQTELGIPVSTVARSMAIQPALLQDLLGAGGSEADNVVPLFAKQTRAVHNG